METGQDFLRSQVNNAVAQHKSFLDSLKDHARQAEDPRFRELCNKYIPMMSQHQGMLEEYQQSLGAEEGTAKKVMATVLNFGKDIVDGARSDDFLRLVGDIVMARQAEDTFKTFREAGRTLGLTPLHHIGESGERGHDEYVKEANALIQRFFVERVRVGVPSPAIV
jgi:hypothetical protein